MFVGEFVTFADLDHSTRKEACAGGEERCTGRMPGRDGIGTPLLVQRQTLGSFLKPRRGRPAEAWTECTVAHPPRCLGTGDRCRQSHRLAAWACLALMSTGLIATQTTASEMAPCLTHTDCRAGEFCGHLTADSYEGWSYQASVCKPCSTCECHIDSATAICPADRCSFAQLLRHTSRQNAKEKQIAQGTKRRNSIWSPKSPESR
jgi:hypothetical protein